MEYPSRLSPAPYSFLSYPISLAYTTAVSLSLLSPFPPLFYSHLFLRFLFAFPLLLLLQFNCFHCSMGIDSVFKPTCVVNVVYESKLGYMPRKRKKVRLPVRRVNRYNYTIRYRIHERCWTVIDCR